MVSLRWSRKSGWIALGVAAGCALALSYLSAATAIETGKGPWVAALVFGLGLAAAAAALFADNAAPVPSRHWTAWLKPRPIAILFLAVFAGFGAMTNALTLFQPRPAVESSPGAIENGVGQILAEVKPPRITPRIRQKLPGIWGETGCRVTYRFDVREKAVTVVSLRRPSGTNPYRLVASIVSESGDELNVTGEEPEAARGMSATFTYRSNSVVERLTWNDRAGSVPLELDRCG